MAVQTQDEKELAEDKKLFAKKAQEILDLKNELHALRKEHKLCPSIEEVNDLRQKIGTPSPLVLARGTDRDRPALGHLYLSR